MKERKAVTREVSGRYQKGRKKEKGVILDEFIRLTEYNRSYGAYLLRSHNQRMRIGRQTVIIADVRKVLRRVRARYYGEDELRALKQIWEILDYICGKRLAASMEEVIPKLRQYKEIRINEATTKKLLKISPATIDRLLTKERRKLQLKARSNTKPGTLLKSQIPIRTFSEWDEQKPGFMEVDLVGHEGGDPRGEFIQTLDMTDICTGWTETEAVRNKAQVHVFRGIQNVREQIPFQLLGLDSDNGGEFINDHLFRYCLENKITFTRTRKYRKNDNCFVEQKNYSVVRRNVGYQRYDTDEELDILNQLYATLRLYTNFFLPVMKLKEKIRSGSRITKRYHSPRTPYSYVLKSDHVPQQKKTELKKIYAKLNPAELKRKITRFQTALLKFGVRKNKARKRLIAA